MPEWKIYARRDSDLVRLGEIDVYQYLTMIPRFNLPGSWEMAVEADSPAAGFLTWGQGIEVTLDDEPFFSGTVTGMARKWSAAGDRLEVTGNDDSVWLARRLCYPEAPALTTATDAYDIRTGVASTVMLGYVQDNVGSTADAARRVDTLAMMTPDPLLGTTVTGRGRFQMLDELLRELALAGGDLGFRVAQSGSQLEFQVYDPADLTSAIMFSADLGNLAEYDFKEGSPVANWFVVGGAGEGAARAFSVGGNGPSILRYERIEAFLDKRDTGDTTQLDQARDEALAEGASQTALSATPVDTGAFQFGVDYNLGDRVTVLVADEPVQDVVREVMVELRPTGTRVTPVVGSPGKANPNIPLVFDRMRRLERRLADLERKV